MRCGKRKYHRILRSLEETHPKKFLVPRRRISNLVAQDCLSPHGLFVGYESNSLVEVSTLQRLCYAPMTKQNGIRQLTVK